MHLDDHCVRPAPSEGQQRLPPEVPFCHLTPSVRPRFGHPHNILLVTVWPESQHLLEFTQCQLPFMNHSQQAL